MNKKILIILMLLLLVQLPILALAEEEDDLTIFDLEVEKLLAFGSGILAAALCAITAVAYQRTQRKRLIFVTVAFFLFAVQSFLLSTELFMEELPYLDPILAFLSFAILLCFFYGVVKR